MSDNTLLATEVISAFISHNSILAADLPELIRAVVRAFDDLSRVSVAQEIAVEKPVPAVPVRKSVHHDFIVSLETGEKFQTLRRHLSGLNLAPDEYRAKWGLPADYPMVARGYSERRSALAKSLGLGRKPSEPVKAPAKVRKPRSKATVVEAPATEPESVQEPAEASSTTIKARPNDMAAVEAEAPAAATGSVQEPSETQQQAA